MVYPAAMFIEAAQDSLKRMSQEDVDHHLKELNFAIGKADDLKFADGYMLGLQTARVILAGSVALAKAGVEAETIL